MTVFDRAFDIVLGAEGGYTVDSGGETKYGISKRSYPTLNIATLTIDDARTIYRRDYWDKIYGDDLPPPIALVVFDAKVNGGDPIRWMQSAAKVTPDGVIGPVTIASVRAARAGEVVSEVCARRLVYLTSLPTWSTYGLGWSRRIAHLCIAAVGFDASPAITLQTIEKPPIMATLEMVKEAIREVEAEKVAA